MGYTLQNCSELLTENSDRLASIKNTVANLPEEKQLNFVTAGADQILTGFVGSDTNGNPVHGALEMGADFFELTPTATTYKIGYYNQSAIKIDLNLDYIPSTISLAGSFVCDGKAFNYSVSIYGGYVYGTAGYYDSSATVYQYNLSELYVNGTGASLNKGKAALNVLNTTTYTIYLVYTNSSSSVTSVSTAHVFASR